MDLVNKKVNSKVQHRIKRSCCKQKRKGAYQFLFKFEIYPQRWAMYAIFIEMVSEIW
jgi:hypothetical protein